MDMTLEGIGFYHSMQNTIYTIQQWIRHESITPQSANRLYTTECSPKRIAFPGAFV